MFSIRMADVLCRDSIQYESLFHHRARSSAAWIICWNVLYLCFWVRTKDLGSTLHRSIVVEVLLDLLPSVWRTAVGRMNGLSWRGGKLKSRDRGRESSGWSVALKQNTLTLFFLHFHHLPLPLIKGGDILGVFAAHRGFCVRGNRGAQVLPDTRKEIRAGRAPSRWKAAHMMAEIFTCSFIMWDVLASRCCELGAAGELGGGLGCVPAVWTLEVFSRTIGGLLWGPKRPFYRRFARVLYLILNIKAAGVNFKSVLVYVHTCRDHTGFPLHSWRELGPDHWSQRQMHQVHPQKCCNKN